MTIIVDANVLPNLIAGKPEFADFRPVCEWITKTNGAYFVTGGTKYLCELRKVTSLLGLLAAWKAANKYLEIQTNLVDDLAKHFKELEPCKDFDDEHLLALVVVTGVKIVASHDTRNDKYLKKGIFYPNNKCHVKIYKNKKHIRLLCAKNIVKIDEALVNLKM